MVLTARLLDLVLSFIELQVGFHVLWQLQVNILSVRVAWLFSCRTCVSSLRSPNPPMFPFFLSSHLRLNFPISCHSGVVVLGITPNQHRIRIITHKQHIYGDAICLTAGVSWLLRELRLCILALWARRATWQRLSLHRLIVLWWCGWVARDLFLSCVVDVDLPAIPVPGAVDSVLWCWFRLSRNTHLWQYVSSPNSVYDFVLVNRCSRLKWRYLFKDSPMQQALINQKASTWCPPTILPAELLALLSSLRATTHHSLRRARTQQPKALSFTSKLTSLSLMQSDWILLPNEKARSFLRCLSLVGQRCPANFQAKGRCQLQKHSRSKWLQLSQFRLLKPSLRRLKRIFRNASFRWCIA